MKLLLAIGITCGILGVLFLISVCCFFHSLKVAIDVIDAAADFLAKTKRVILVPVLYFFVNIIAVLIWLSAYISITSLNWETVESDQSKSIHQIKLVISTKDEATNTKVFNFQMLMLFGILWFIALQIAKVRFIAMVSASSYYFSSNKDKDGSATVCLGFKFAYLNHLGSLCIGSFIIALI